MVMYKAIVYKETEKGSDCLFISETELANESDAAAGLCSCCAAVG